MSRGGEHMKSFLTIGQLSKLSGIHTKALRYYESINILKPAYVDPINSYRYYTYSAIPYVKVIKICADYGIPLKKFINFINDNNEIMISEILQIAQDIIKEKEEALQQDKNHIEQFKSQINLSKQLDYTSYHHIETGDEDYLILPFVGEILSDAYYREVYKLLISLSVSKISFEQRVGCYYKKIGNTWKQYIACKIDHSKEYIDFDTICLKNSHIHGEHIDQKNIPIRIKELDAEFNVQELLIIETLECPYNFTKPHLELRYLYKTSS